MKRRYFKISEEVETAWHEQRAIVALESTIIAHGMPFPENIATARRLEAVIRQAGAVPATMAILNGSIMVGLNDEELNQLATARDVMKLSRRDLAWAVAHKKSGATTVAATMMIAADAEIDLFATGGIGGVHRGAELNWDVSADLTELARTPVNVVSAGPKAILDLPATLEYLETLGVPVLGYQTHELPAFYSRRSNLPLELSASTAAEVAHFIFTRQQLASSGGVLIANPIPEAHEIAFDQMEVHIQHALAAAEEQGVNGKRLTPFLLDQVRQNTQGQSLAANIALVVNNARIAAEIAVALADRKAQG
jgi:pseudouridine-5'-phosphate glycosidase